MTFILAMAMHPRVAHKAQEEIDSVLDGISVRLPRFEDRKDLPYTECILKEVLRLVALSSYTRPP
jgi:cytochrome P450